MAALDSSDDNPHTTSREPDVTIVLKGGIEVQHVSSQLCYSSDYFNAIFSRGFNRTELPHKTIEEWNLVSPYLEAGVIQTPITTDTVRSLLIQFNELALTNKGPLLAACDDVYAKRLERMLTTIGSRQSYSPNEIDEFTEALKLGFEYKNSMRRTFRSATTMLQKAVGKKTAAILIQDIKLELGSDYTDPTIPWITCGEPFGRWTRRLLLPITWFWSKSAVTCFGPKMMGEEGNPENKIRQKDVTIVLKGGAKVHHSSLQLCYSSDYFNAMFSHGFKESVTKQVEFPHKTIKEWKLVSPYLEAGILRTPITTETAQSLLPQFHELALVNSGPFMAACDDVYATQLEHELFLCKHYSKTPRSYTPRDIEYFTEALKLGFAFEDTMPRTIRSATTLLQRAVGEKQAAVISKGVRLQLSDGYTKPTISPWTRGGVQPLSWCVVDFLCAAMLVCAVCVFTSLPYHRTSGLFWPFAFL